jgi:RNA polymerase sigma factor (sigma-70 family)
MASPPESPVGDYGFEAGENPLLSDSPLVWDRLIEAVGPPSLLVVIASRLGAALARQHAPEDVLQEALLHAWRDRTACEWRGVPHFRRWLLGIVDHRIADLADREKAAKRGGGVAPVQFSSLSGQNSGSTLGWQWAGPSPLTTPSRAAEASERAAAMTEALDELPVDLREVVRLRLFEDLALREIAERLGLGLSAVAHRFRRGAAEYHRSLGSILTRRSEAGPG